MASFAGLPVTTIGSDDDAASHTCSFDHITTVGVAMDVITFQAPLVITVILNVYLYIRGLNSLKDSPFSVLSRRLRRASGYIIVLVVVWVPNLLYNALCIFGKTNTGFTVLESIVVNVASAQVTSLSFVLFARRFHHRPVDIAGIFQCLRVCMVTAENAFLVLQEYGGTCSDAGNSSLH